MRSRLITLRILALAAALVVLAGGCVIFYLERIGVQTGQSAEVWLDTLLVESDSLRMLARILHE